MKNLKIAIIFLLFSSHYIHSQLYFEKKQSKYSSYDKDIVLYDNDQQIGCVSYKKLPLIPIYLIYNLYVYPAFRHKGYGRRLLAYCCHIVKKHGGKKVYIQPGPFELAPGGLAVINSDDYNRQMQRLITFYQKNGFKQVSIITSLSAFFIYRIVGIDENACYLMVKEF